MGRKKIVYFVTLRQNANIVLRQALNQATDHEVQIFFDLDGARVLNPEYLKTHSNQSIIDVAGLLDQALKSKIKLYGCQMNVMAAAGMKTMEGVELAGVVTFLQHAYQADAVLSY